jgi:hypothetical protein
MAVDLRKTTKNLSHDIRCPDRDSNRTLQDNEVYCCINLLGRKVLFLNKTKLFSKPFLWGGKKEDVKIILK